MLKFFIIILFSISLFASNQSILKSLNTETIKNKKESTVSFIVFNLDDVLLNTSTRFEFIFDNYLKKHRSRVLKKYFNDKNFTDLKLNDVLNDIDSLKLSKKQKEKFKKYLEENYNSDDTLGADIAIAESVNFVNSLYKNGAFIVYITKRSSKLIAPTIDKLKKINFPIAKTKTMLIMDVNDENIVNTIYSFINMGKVISVFSNDIKNISKLKPYFKKDELFLISKDILDSKDFNIIKGF